jgi:hypothetical protein
MFIVYLEYLHIVYNHGNTIQINDAAGISIENGVKKEATVGIFLLYIIE